MHAEVGIVDTVLMIADQAPPHWPASASHVHVYVPDVDATYRRALEAGAIPVQEPVRKENGGVAWGFGPGLYPLPDSEARSKRMMEMEEV